MSERRKPTSDFSIERILDLTPDSQQRPDVKERLQQPEYTEEFTNFWDVKWKPTVPGDDLPWLRCTRYKPPKLPRKSATKPAKRKLGSHPRIPFTKFQLEVLEERYKNGAYLTSKDVSHLSGLLHLPQSRVSLVICKKWLKLALFYF